MATSYKEFRNELMRDPEFKTEYDALYAEFAIIQAMIDARNATDMTKKELSAKTGMTQAQIPDWRTTMRIHPCARFAVWRQL